MQDCVIDISHWSGLNLDFLRAKAAGIQGVISKCTQGTRYIDPRYTINRQNVLATQLLFGSFHFGTGNASGKNQADYYLSNTKQGDLLCLDFEPNPKDKTMSIDQALEFCAVVEQEAERPIVIYTGLPMVPYAAQLRVSVLGPDRPLWWAMYRPAPSGAPWAITLWQYTEHGLVDGIGHCDRNQFYGDDLNTLWKFDSLAGVTGGMEGETS